MLLHPSIRWALFAHVISARYLPERDSGESLLLKGMVEGNIRLFVGVLLEEIELDLKGLVEAYHQRRHGHAWWSTLPDRVRGNAKKRYDWTAAELGTRRLNSFPSVHWLTIGEVLTVLKALPHTDWQACLWSEAARRSDFTRALRRIKTFRDYMVAHPKPRTPSTAELTRLCAVAEHLPSVLCPIEWGRAGLLLQGLLTAPERWRIHTDLSVPASTVKGSARLWAAQVMLDPVAPAPNHAGRSRYSEVRWRLEVLKAAATYDGGGSVFFRSPAS